MLVKFVFVKEDNSTGRIGTTGLQRAQLFLHWGGNHGSTGGYGGLLDSNSRTVEQCNIPGVDTYSVAAAICSFSRSVESSDVQCFCLYPSLDIPKDRFLECTKHAKGVVW